MLLEKFYLWIQVLLWMLLLWYRESKEGVNSPSPVPLNLLSHLCYPCLFMYPISYHQLSPSVPGQLIQEFSLSENMLIKVSFRKIAYYLHQAAWPHNNDDMYPETYGRPSSLDISLTTLARSPHGRLCSWILKSCDMAKLTWCFLTSYKRERLLESLVNMEGPGGYISLSFGCKVSAVCSTESKLWLRHFEQRPEVLCLPSFLFSFSQS